MILLRIILNLFWLALALGVTDAMVDMTKLMGHEAIHAHQKGLMSYGKVTRMLTE
jgi:hypothetical protein